MNRKITTKAQAGFTLVELSIVIVIIGFLVAGIAAGANLVKQAQLRSVISDINSFQTAYNGFINAYNGAPGDITTASSYWTALGAAANACGTTAATNCNGNGDGNINVGINLGGAAAPTDEAAPAWKELQLAGFVAAGITVIPAAVANFTPGTNAPQSKITGAGYMMTTGTASTGSTAALFTRNATAGTITAFNTSKNYLYLGKVPSTNSGVLNGGSLTGQDAFNIDQKVDDGGLSGTTFIGYNSGNFQAKEGQNATANGCITAAPAYNVTATTTDCLVGWQLN